MKRVTMRVLIATLTFLIGTAAVYLWLIRRPQPLTLVLPGIEKAGLDNDRPAFVEVFNDFEYVGSFTSGQAAPPHGIAVQPLPTHFEPGWQYIFHQRNPTDNDSLFSELQARLRSKDIGVLDAQAELYAYLDGLHFHILFQDGRYRGRIENRVDHQIASSRDSFLRKRLFVDDYVLTIESY